MYGYSSYVINFTGPEEEIQKLSDWVKTLFDGDPLVCGEAWAYDNCVEVFHTQKIRWVYDIAMLAKELIKRSQAVSAFTIKGTVNSHTNKDFLITYENGALFSQESDWYLTMDAADCESHEDIIEFCEALVVEYSDEAFEEIKKCCHYILGEGHGEVVTSVPLHAPERIALGRSKAETADSAAPEISGFGDGAPPKAALTLNEILDLAGNLPAARHFIDTYWRDYKNVRDRAKAYALAYILAEQGDEQVRERLASAGELPEQLIEEYPGSLVPPEGLPLGGTQYEGRAERCEAILPGMELQGRLGGDENGEFIEFFHGTGSVGQLPEWFAPPLIALLKLGKIDISAIVTHCIPKSQRGRRARNADVRYRLVIREKETS